MSRKILLKLLAGKGKCKNFRRTVGWIETSRTSDCTTMISNESMPAPQSIRIRAAEVLNDPVEEILTSRSVLSARPDDTLAVACRTLQAEEDAILLVVAHGVVVGVMNDADIVRAIAKGRGVSETILAEVMTYRPSVLSCDGTIGEALSMMGAAAVDTLPVIDKGQVVGTLSYRDIPYYYKWAFDLLELEEPEPPELAYSA